MSGKDSGKDDASMDDRIYVSKNPEESERVVDRIYLIRA